MFMFLKVFVGSGVLFLPKAFENGGSALSPVLMVLIAFISFFAILRLVKTQELVGGSYDEIGGYLCGNIVRCTVLFFIVLSQLGFVCSYFVFISGNIVNIVEVLSNCRVEISQGYYMWIVAIPIIPLALIRHITKLSMAAIIADVFILFGLISCIYFTSNELYHHGIAPEVKAVNPTSFALMIGTGTFAFEGISLVLPISDTMKEPTKFPFVVSVGMTIVCFVYILIGEISYMAYGSQIQAAVTYNFPASSPLTISVQLLYSIAIVLSAPIMLFPAINILEKGPFRHLSNKTWSKNTFRFLVVLACTAIAFVVGGKNLDVFVSLGLWINFRVFFCFICLMSKSLVGSLACVPLCFIFPGLFHLKIAKSTKDRILDTLLILFGATVMIYTLYVTVFSLVHPGVEVPQAQPFCPSRA
ncbi:transmembrane amino acid transporter protein-domain-containing protein [Sporodiniella umbellata]|nr:transmembrane amino acid transporter protein-domain-containing protein [Sporodiniella umbellata]